MTKIKTFDVLVIGAGVIGLTAALRLSEQGLSVAIIDAGDCGGGASGAALGVITGPSPLKRSLVHSLHRKSLASYPKFIEELEALTGLSTGYRKCGLLEPLLSSHQLEAAEKKVAIIPERRAEGECIAPLEILSTAAAIEMEPQVTATPYGALYASDSGLCDVQKLLQTVRTACEKFGASLYERTPVLKLDYNQNVGIVTAITKSVSFVAERCLVAAGLGTTKLHPELQRLAIIEHVKGQALAVNSNETSIKRVVRWDKVYLVPHEPNEILIGSTSERRVPATTDTTDDQIDMLLQKATEGLPLLASSKITRRWAGLRPLSDDRKPLLGSVPGYERLFVASGHYKVGLGFAPLTASIMCELMTTGKSAENLSTVTLDPNQRAA